MQLKTIKKIKSNNYLKNKLLASNKSKSKEIAKNNSKLRLKDLNIKNSNLNTIEYNNTYYSERLRYHTQNKYKSKDLNKNSNSNFNYIDKSINTISHHNEEKKELAILKDGIIYWLRKLYIILPENTANFNNNHNLYIYFYYPVKDINIKMEKNFSYKKGEGSNTIFCKNLENILEKVKEFLKIKNFCEFFKFCIYNEDYVLIKNDNQLMEKKDKYKILYVKIKQLSNEQINKKIKRCQFHRHHRKSYESILKLNEIPFQFLTNKEIKYNIFNDTYFTSAFKNKTLLNNKLSYTNIIKAEDYKNENIIQTMTIDNNKDNYNDIMFNKNFFTGESWSSIINNQINFNKNINRNFIRNNTDFKLFPKIYKNINFKKNKYILSETKSSLTQKKLKDFNKKNYIPKIKSKGLWISNTNDNINLLPIKISQKSIYTIKTNSIKITNNKSNSLDSKDYSKTLNESSDNYIYSLSIDRSNNNTNKNKTNENNKKEEYIYNKAHINNIYIKNILNKNYNKLHQINNTCNNSKIYNEKKLLEKKFIIKENLLEKDPCDDAFNIKLRRSIKSPLKINKNKQINNIIEINQIQFIAINNCIKNFMAEKIDLYIDDIDISIIFNKENILKNIKEINGEIPINLYLKEFLCFSYLSNYICDNYKQFCIDLFDEMKDYYININNILSIYKFREFIFNFKNIFHEIKYNKNIMIQKLKENYYKNKNGLNISFVFFILFMIYNKKNLSILFDKELLFSILECIDIHFPNEITVEQFIKFKIFFVKNKWITHYMKQNCINKFFNKQIFNNKNFDVDLFVIKLRPIMKINSEYIKQITKNKLIINNNINAIYSKFIEYFNF